MPRYNRIHIPGAFYHITQRGNSKQTLFFDDRDRAKFCLLMQEGVALYKHRIHAFCLMSNHIHLLIQANELPIGKAMHNLFFRYAMRLNRKFDSTGHRFQGRYYSGLIQDDAHTKETLKYIHLNPVKANMVRSPSEYRWSSHCCYTNQDTIPWLVRDDCLALFGEHTQDAIDEYLSFMGTPQDEKTTAKLNATSSNYIIGANDSIDDAQLKSDQHLLLEYLTIEQVAHFVCEYFDVTLDSLHSSNKMDSNTMIVRGVIGFVIMTYTKNSATSFAKWASISQSTISRAVVHITKENAINNSEISFHINTILQRLWSIDG